MAMPKEGTLEYAEVRGVDQMLLALCRARNITLEELLSDLRVQSIARARAEAAYKLRMRGMSWPEVGAVLGKHHTAVMTAAKGWAVKNSKAIR